MLLARTLVHERESRNLEGRAVIWQGPWFMKELDRI